MIVLLLLLIPFLSTQLWAHELPPLIPKATLFSNPEKAYPQISPDGTMLSYLAQHNGKLTIWIKTLGKSDDHPIFPQPDCDIYDYWWGYDNALFILQDYNGNENYHIYRINWSTGQTTDMTPFDGIKTQYCAGSVNKPHEILITMNKENKSLFDVYSLSLLTGELKLVEKNPGNVKSWIADNDLQIRGLLTFASDGTASLLFRATINEPWQTAITWQPEDFMAVSVAVTTLRVFGFSPDGTKIYLKDSNDTDTVSLIEYDCASKHRTILASDSEYDVTGILRTHDKKIIAACANKDRIKWIAIDQNFAPLLQAMQAVDSGDLFFCNSSLDQCKWVIGFDHDTSAVTYYLFNTQSCTAEYLFTTRPNLGAYQLSPMEPITFQARDGLTVHGYLSYPVEQIRTNLPLILLVHGGPWTRDSWFLSPTVQWMTNRGYACLQINYRGSVGYGKQFLNAGNREWGGTMQDDLTDAVQWAIDQGIANPNKIAIYGCSYGGYAALMGAAMTPDLFCCAVDICGPTDLVSALKSLPAYWACDKKDWNLRVGDPELDAEFLRSRSPLYKVDTITIPVLIAQGAYDPRVKQSESEQMVAALQTREIPCEYLLFSDEGHGIAKPKNRLTFMTSAEKFLAHHLGGRCET